MNKLIISKGGKHLPYLKVTPHQKATIAKYAAEHSVQIIPLLFLHLVGYGASHYSHACKWTLASNLAVSLYFRTGLGQHCETRSNSQLQSFPANRI